MLLITSMTLYNPILNRLEPCTTGILDFHCSDPTKQTKPHCTRRCDAPLRLPRPLEADPKAAGPGKISHGCIMLYQWIGLRENLQENPIFHGKICGFLYIFP